MKQNECYSLNGWYNWARFEGVDADGAIYQFEEAPQQAIGVQGVYYRENPGTRLIYTGKSTTPGPILTARYTETTTVVDQLNDIRYLPGGGANFRLTVTDGTTEQTAAVDLFEFLIWAQADGIIDSYSAENVGEEVVILPVPDEDRSHRATAQIKRLYAWLQQLPLATFVRALNERPAMWTAFDENMEPINA